MKYIIGQLHSENGIQRDGTDYNSKSYIDGLWVRFYEDQPTKMPGCTVVSPNALGDNFIISYMFGWSLDAATDVYCGRYNSLQYLQFQKTGAVLGPYDVTPPTTRFAEVLWDPANVNNLWDFDVFTSLNTDDGIESEAFIVSSIAPNRTDISNEQGGAIFYGPVDTPGPLTLIVSNEGFVIPASGGIVFVSPVMVAYGNNGIIYWSNPGEIQSWPIAPNGDIPGNFAVIANTKIVQAYTTRGGVLFWSLNSLIRAAYGPITVSNTTGTVTTTQTYNTFSHETVQSDISILAANSVIQYDQMFYWIGLDQFYFYNGIVNTMPNIMNNDWFFNNVNKKASNKIWGIVVPRFKELWWYYPRVAPDTNPADITADQECNAVIIFNLQENKWYDCTIPPNQPLDGTYPWTRSAGIKVTAGYPFALYADNTLVTTPSVVGNISTYPIWQHENPDQLNYFIEPSGLNLAIPSSFTTHIQDLWSGDGAISNLMRIRRIAPDFVQNGEMNVSVNTQMYPNDLVVSTTPIPFDKDPSTINYKQFVDFAVQGGLVSFKFSINVLDGFYQAGKILCFYEKGDTLK